MVAICFLVIVFFLFPPSPLDHKLEPIKEHLLIFLLHILICCSMSIFKYINDPKFI